MTKAERQKRNKALIAEHMPKPWPIKPRRNDMIIARRHCRGYVRFMVMQRAVTMSGDYIGDPKFARSLFVKRGLIEVQPRDDGRGIVCSIGFQPDERKWYGWSHRAMFGFGVGAKIFDEKLAGADDQTPFDRHGTEDIKDLHDAKVAASRFASSVS